MLVDHCEAKAIELFKKKDGAIPPVSHIQVPLHKVFVQLPMLVNSPIFVNVITESVELSVFRLVPEPK